MELVSTVEWVASSPNTANGEVLTGTEDGKGGTAGDDAAKLALDGNSYLYTAIATMVADTTTMVLDVEPNAITAGRRTYFANGSGQGTLGTTASQADWNLFGEGGVTAGTSTAMAIGEFFLQSGYPRAHQSIGVGREGTSVASGDGRCQPRGGTLYDVSTLNDNVTSLRFTGGGFGFRTGTKIRLYRTPIIFSAANLNSDLIVRDTIKVVASGAGQGELNTGANRVVFPTDALNQYAMVGNSGDLWVFHIDVRQDGSALEVYAEPNGQTSNLGRYNVIGTGSGTYTSLGAANWQCHGHGGGTAGTTYARVTVYVDPDVGPGKRRTYIARAGGRDGSGGATTLRNQVWGGTWEELATEMTSFAFNGGGSGWRTNSRFTFSTLKGSL